MEQPTRSRSIFTWPLTPAGWICVVANAGPGQGKLGQQQQRKNDRQGDLRSRIRYSRPQGSSLEMKLFEIASLSVFKKIEKNLRIFSIFPFTKNSASFFPAFHFF